MDEIVLVPGGKKEFMDWTNASTKSDQWKHNYSDYECFEKMLGNENLRFMVAKTKSGKYVGSCMCVVFPEYAFVASYYICPEFRGQGIGTRLFSMAVNDEVMKKNIGLHSAPAMAAIYHEKLGFKVKLPWLAYKLVAKNINFPKLSGLASDLMVKNIKEVSLEQLTEYDAKIAKENRKPFVRYWIYERSDAVSKVVLNSSSEIVGYGSAHLYSILDSPTFAPIYADNDLVFGAIFCTLASHYKEQIQAKNLIDLSVPTEKLEAIKTILHGIADTETLEAETPLFTKSIPDHDIEKIYSTADLSLFI